MKHTVANSRHTLILKIPFLNDRFSETIPSVVCHFSRIAMCWHRFYTCEHEKRKFPPMTQKKPNRSYRYANAMCFLHCPFLQVSGIYWWMRLTFHFGVFEFPFLHSVHLCECKAVSTKYVPTKFRIATPPMSIVPSRTF